MSTGTAVNTGDLITAAKMNLKLEDLSNNEENSAFAFLRLRASGTLPAGTVAYIGLDNTNDVTVNALSTGAVNIAIAGTDEYTFDATAFTVVSGNTIDFNAAAGAWAVLLRDVNNNELLETYATASAVNHIGIRNVATGSLPLISARGSDANTGLLLTDNNDNELLRLGAVASAVNEVTILNAATGVRPTIRSQGEADLGLILASYDGTNSEEILILAAAASAVNEFTMTSAATTANPDLAVSGGDTNISMTLSTKGTGTIILRSATTSRVAVNNAYSMTLYQATANYTLAWSDPGAARTITFPDPGGNDSVVYLAAAQTLTSKTISAAAMTGIFTGAHTYSGILTLTAASMALTAGAAFTLGTTDAFTLVLRTGNATRWTLAAASSNITAAGAADIIGQATTDNMIQVTDGTTAMLSFDSRTATDNIISISLGQPAPTIANVAGTGHSMFGILAYTLTLSGTTTVTAIDGLSLDVAAPTIAQSGGAVTVTTASTIMLRPITAGSLVTITNSRMINTSVAGCFLTAAGVWTDASSIEHKLGVRPVDWDRVLREIQGTPVVSYQRRDPTDGGFERYGVVAEEAPDCLATLDRKGVAAGYMAGFALAGVQALIEQVTELQARVRELEALVH